MMQFTFLQLLDEALSRCEQINESSSSINVSTDSCMEILENDDFFPKCNTLTIRTQTVKKSTREKGTQHKDATTSLYLFAIKETGQR